MYQLGSYHEAGDTARRLGGATEETPHQSGEGRPRETEGKRGPGQAMGQVARADRQGRTAWAGFVGQPPPGTPLDRAQGDEVRGQTHSSPPPTPICECPQRQNPHGAGERASSCLSTERPRSKTQSVDLEAKKRLSCTQSPISPWRET